MKRLFKLVTALFLVINIHAQNYQSFGDSYGISSFNNSCPSDTCFTLTPDLLWKTGAIYSDDLFDLTLPFDGTFCLFLGTKDGTGADGFAFVLKDTNVPSIGLSGGSIGYGSLAPSVAIEFDTWDNGGADIPADHTSLHYNGNSILPIVPSISLSSSGANVEDGMPHTARIVWTPRDTTLYMFFDNVLRFSHKVDLINRIFGGKTKVNWGFTSSTGGSSNLQQICFPAKPVSIYYDTLCQDSCLDFGQVPYDPNFSYSWNNGIQDTLPFVSLCPSSAITYNLYKQSRLTSLIDTISVILFMQSKPDIELPKKSVLCSGSLLLDVQINGGLSYNWSNGSQSSEINIFDTGFYWVEVRTAYCRVRETIKIICPKLPNVFSPNSDGINDYFSPLKDYSISEGNFQIYNRWGNIVYESTDIISIQLGWDGKQNGKTSSDGVYYFTLSYREKKMEEPKQIAGSFHLFK
ncbi:gliding motility-associated C-terminal domain-containing protein [Flavobacteriales bacterium]|nr:gliding motility-associated C-terminal domain-containing protein [Flavobacteriales bacterium]